MVDNEKVVERANQVKNCLSRVLEEMVWKAGRWWYSESGIYEFKIVVVVQLLAKRMCRQGMNMGVGSWGRLEEVNKQIKALETIFLGGLNMTMLIF